MNKNKEWLNFLQKLQKDNNALYELLKETDLDAGKELRIYHPNEEGKAEIEKKRGKIQAKLVKMYPHWQSLKLTVQSGEQVLDFDHEKITEMENPLQALNHQRFSDHAQPVLEEASAADATCSSIYAHLTERTKTLAEETLEVKFSWRLRVGGMRGFQELLLPVFHPVYGIPYVPAASLKGATRAWARQHGASKDEINKLLGELDKGVGCVQILDAFPKAPCLSVDMANPQWRWENNQVKYKPEPHALLSMKEPELVIGLVRTHQGKRQQQDNDLQTVKTWLENALAAGIGSRVSAGYGRTQPQAILEHSSSNNFKMWTQGMYGANPPTKENNYQGIAEFRTSGVRGVLRYWFRAVALGLYDVETCQELETKLFGGLSKEGCIRLGINLTKQEVLTNTSPDFYEGSILLESQYLSRLLLVKNVLKLFSNIAGLGRGSRRPLHLNNNRMRGCHWELNNLKLAFDKNEWQQFLESLISSFKEVHQPTVPANMNPGNDRNRYQDVLNSDTKIFLVPSPQQKHPNSVNNWQIEGSEKPVLGEALNLLYSSPNFKGEKEVKQKDGSKIKIGNPLVGGKLEIPSFVIIKSIFPASGHPYQVVTIFGSNHPERQKFVQALPTNSVRVSAFCSFS